MRDGVFHHILFGIPQSYTARTDRITSSFPVTPRLMLFSSEFLAYWDTFSLVETYLKLVYEGYRD
jgi:hypothetical protein